MKSIFTYRLLSNLKYAFRDRVSNPIKTFPLLFLCSILFCFTNTFGQLAPVNPPTLGFAIDGGLRSNTPTAGQGDWYPNGAGGGGSVFDALGNPINASTTGNAVPPDAYGSNDNIFTNGSKFNDYISSLQWFSNSAPNKNDINQALYHISRDGSNNQWAFIAGDRLSTSGTSYIDFEFLQGTVVQNANGTFTGNPVTTKNYGGGRTENDMIVSMEYTNGGSKPVVYIYQWKQSGNTWSYQLANIPNLAANAYAETNRTGAETNLPYNAFGNTSYPQFAFVEAAINITYLLSQTSGGNACAGLSIQTLWIKTKASASSTAALKDFVEPIRVNFQFGESSITVGGPFCVSNTTPQTLTATPEGGVFSGAGVSLIDGAYKFTPSAVVAGTHTINYSHSGCTASTTITVTALPTVYNLGGNSICTSALGTGVITLSGSETGVSYQLKKASDHSIVQTAQGGTGFPLAWSALPANINYYVLATGAAPTNCTSQTANASVSEVANPAIYALSGNSICATAPNTGVITLSNSQTGISYQLKKVSDNITVGAAQSGTDDAPLSWSALPAGVSYYVLATGWGPTNCNSRTTNAAVLEVANPTIYALSGNSICATAPNTGIITLINSQTGVSYELKKVTGNITVGTAQNGTDGASLSWSELPAGVNYYVLATGAAPTNCTSRTANAAVSEVANPVVYDLSGNSICASAPGTGVITLSDSETGVSYQLKKVSDHSLVQTSQAGTGSPLTWSALPANINYYVLATGAAPTNCTSQTLNASVSEVANPTVYGLSGNSICASAPSTGVITLSDSETGVSYQLKKASDHSIVQTAQAGTGSSLTWSSIPANIDYYVLATGATPTNCTSLTANASVSEVANPAVYTLSGNSICASAPGTGELTLTTSQTGVSYQLKKASDNSVVQTAQAGTGSPLIWPGIGAGVNYYVLATGASPTNCTSQTANASVTETPNPDEAVVSTVNPTCSTATGTVTVTSPVGSQYEYSYNGAAYTTSTGPFTFAAGAGYSIIVRNRNTLCVSNAGSCPAQQGRSSNNPEEARNADTKVIPPPSAKSEVIKIDASSDLTSVSAYPNPFNDKVRFVVIVSQSGRGTLEVFNMLGQKVKTVYQGFVPAGVNSFDLNLKGQKTSSLIYKFKMGEKLLTGKLLQITQ